MWHPGNILINHDFDIMTKRFDLVIMLLICWRYVSISLTTPLFVKKFIQVNNKETINA